MTDIIDTLKKVRRGAMFIIEAPSGTGKTSVIKKLMELDNNLKFSVSATTRKPREGEKDGVDYYYISDEKYDELLSKLNKDLGIVIYIEIDKDMAMKRACSRITCPKCGSRLSWDYLKGNTCPLCETDLRSDTVLSRLKSFDERIVQAKKQYRQALEEARKNCRNKNAILWRFKVEVHC